MDTGKPRKPGSPRRDGRPGSGLLIRPHGGAETRVKSGGRAGRISEAGKTSAGDVPNADESDEALQRSKDAD
jgi:hypothetical protein